MRSFALFLVNGWRYRYAVTTRDVFMRNLRLLCWAAAWMLVILLPATIMEALL